MFYVSDLSTFIHSVSLISVHFMFTYSMQLVEVSGEEATLQL